MLPSRLHLRTRNPGALQPRLRGSSLRRRQHIEALKEFQPIFLRVTSLPHWKVRTYTARSVVTLNAVSASNNGSTKSAQDVEIHSASHSKANTSSSTQTSAPSHFMAGCASQPVGVTQFATLQRPAPTLVPAPARRFAPPSPLHDSRLPVRAVESATSETVTQPHALPPQPSTSAPAAHILRAAILAHAQPFGNRYSRPAEPVLAASPSVRSEPPEGRDASPALAPTASSSDGPAREPQGAQVAPAPSASINAISPPSLSAPDGHAVALLSKVAPVQLDAVREGPDVLPPPAPSSASFDRAPPRVSIPTASAEPPTMHIASTPPPAPARALDDDNDTRGQTSFPHTTVQMPQRASDGEHVTAIAPEMADLLDALTPPPPPAKFRLVQVGAQVLRVPAGRGVPIGALLRERRDVAVVPPSRDRTQASVQPQEPQTQNTKKKKRRQKKRASRAGSGTPPLPY